MRFTAIAFVTLAALLATSSAANVGVLQSRGYKRDVGEVSRLGRPYKRSIEDVKMQRRVVKRGDDYSPQSSTKPSSGSGTTSDDYSPSSGSGTTSGTTSDDYTPSSGSGSDSNSSGQSTDSGDGSYGGGKGSSPSWSSGASGSGSSGGFSPDCSYDSTGTLTSASISGCPHQITITGKGNTGCKVNNKGKLVTVDALDCSNVCVLSNNCSQLQNCSIDNQGLIVVSALSCSNVDVLSNLGLRK